MVAGRLPPAMTGYDGSPRPRRWAISPVDFSPRGMVEPLLCLVAFACPWGQRRLGMRRRSRSALRWQAVQTARTRSMS